MNSHPYPHPDEPVVIVVDGDTGDDVTTTVEIEQLQ
jgi:hypothetical protein